MTLTPPHNVNKELKKQIKIDFQNNMSITDISNKYKIARKRVYELILTERWER